MPLFEITKPIMTTLVVECASEQEAINWVDKIVASIEDEDGNLLHSKKIVSFEADVKISKVKIENLQSKQ